MLKFISMDLVSIEFGFIGIRDNSKEVTMPAFFPVVVKIAINGVG
jgi:hypothetical protein